MSHRIVYDILAVRFPGEALRSHVDHYRFVDDAFLLLELGGDNNCYTVVGRSERRARAWDVLALGCDWEVMRQAATFSSSCEGGGLRLTGSSRTQAETYIRRHRQAVATAAMPDAAGHVGLSCSVTLRIDAAPLSRRSLDELEALRAFGVSAESPEGVVSVDLSPLHDMAHAAALFAWHHLDERSVYNKMRIHGPCFERIPLSRRLPAIRQNAMPV